MTTHPTGPLYCVEILGGNAVGNFVEVRRGGILLAAVDCSTSGQPGAFLRVHSEDAYVAPGDENIALFVSEHLAREIATAATWNGQRFRIRAARGNRRATGEVVVVEPGDTLRSRSNDSDVEISRPAHRPRRDPTAARVVRSYRLHPDTIARIDAESKRSGESAGQVIDRLAATL
jgi:hypothetical protein